MLSTERPRMGLVYHAGEGANLLDYQVWRQAALGRQRWTISACMHHFADAACAAV